METLRNAALKLGTAGRSERRHGIPWRLLFDNDAGVTDVPFPASAESPALRSFSSVVRLGLMVCLIPRTLGGKKIKIHISLLFERGREFFYVSEIKQCSIMLALRFRCFQVGV